MRLTAAGMKDMRQRRQKRAESGCTIGLVDEGVSGLEVIYPQAASSQRAAEPPIAPPNFCAMEEEEKISPVEAVL